jgi:hypothetical protein
MLQAIFKTSPSSFITSTQYNTFYSCAVKIGLSMNCIKQFEKIWTPSSSVGYLYTLPFIPCRKTKVNSLLWHNHIIYEQLQRVKQHSTTCHSINKLFSTSLDLCGMSFCHFVFVVFSA